MLTYRQLISEFRCDDSQDSWGTVMHWWFTVADELNFNRPALTVPESWRFRPSPLGPQNEPGDYAANAVAESSDDALARFGALLNRYAGFLKRRGKDY